LLSLSSSANLSSINLPGEPCSGDGSIPAQRLRTPQRGRQQDPHQPSTPRNQIRCRGCNKIEEQLWPDLFVFNQWRDGVRGVAACFLTAFDKHWNFALTSGEICRGRGRIGRSPKKEKKRLD